MELMQKCGILDFCANLIRTIHNPKQFLRFLELRGSWNPLFAINSQILHANGGFFHLDATILQTLHNPKQFL